MTSVFLAPCGQPTMQRPQRMQPVRSGPSPPKYGSATVSPGSPKKTPTRRLAVGVADADVLAELAQQVVGGVVGRHGRRRRASARPRRSAAPAPASQSSRSRPLRVLEERRARAVERVGVAEAAAADAAAADDRDVLEDATGGRCPSGRAAAARSSGAGPRSTWGSRRRRSACRTPAADRVALLGQAQRRDAAAEAGADDDPVEVVAVARHCVNLPK